MIEIKTSGPPIMIERLGPQGAMSEVLVVRDDLLEGGSKTRFLPAIAGDAKELVFGAPAQGGAPVAIAAVCKRLGLKATIFYAKRAKPHRRQQQAIDFGAKVIWVKPGYMTVVQKRARDYALKQEALFFPLGFDTPKACEAMTEQLLTLRHLGKFNQVWCCTGSGMLAKCLSLAFPDARIKAVAVGLKSRWSVQEFAPNVDILESEYRYEQECKYTADFPACPNYERKGFQLMKRFGVGRALFFNVIGE